MEKRILIADDERHLRFTVGLALKRLGCRVAEAADGREALEKIRRAREEGAPFDLLVTDIQMSPMGGLELLDGIAGEGLHLPVLIVSGYLDDKLFGELIRRKIFDHLEKPLSLDELVSRVEHLLRPGGEHPPALAGGAAGERRAFE